MRSATVLVLLLATGVATAAADPFPSVLEPASTGGLEAVDHALARLSTHRRLLLLAAHPDDEDTRTLARTSIAEGGEAVYLSLTRGEGGQNLIGDELGERLGVLRSRELLAARGIDGARQRFSRAYDFGYTRSMAETFERWPFDELLEDAIRVVRRERPQVLLAVFPPTPRAGHGQHQASGALAAEVFERAGATDGFPHLDDEGLAPWPIASFWRATWWDPSATTLELSLGTIDPFSGRSTLQLALESRSQHRCQDMGLLQPIGEATASLGWVAGVGGPEADDLFAGVDTRLEAIAADLADPTLRATIEARLRTVAELARSARSRVGPVEPWAAAEPLLEIVGLLRRCETDLAAAAAGDDPDPAVRHARALLAEKREIAEEALPWAAGLAVDAVTDREAWTPGSEGRIRLAWWTAGPLEIELEKEALEGWEPRGPVGAPEEDGGLFAFRARPTGESWHGVAVPDRAEASRPWYLEAPRDGDLYDWSGADPELWHRPFGPPPLVARFDFLVEGVPITVRREVVMQRRDQARGEIRRPLRVVPEIEVEVPNPVRILARGAATSPLRVVLRSHAAEERAVDVRLDGLPASAAPDAVPVTVAPGVTEDLTIDLPPRERLGTARIDAVVVADAGDGRRWQAAYPLVDYEHVRPTPTRVEADVAVVAGDLELPAIGRLGFVTGASQRVPEVLREAGLPLEELDPERLLGGDLSRFDVIVVGSRAFETRPELGTANPRLLDWVRSGGTLIVLYQQYQFARGRFAPFPLEIARPHDRITDESSSLRVLAPDHPVFRHPHRISREDWLGWVQERGLYFAHTWDGRYRPLLAMTDPGGEETSGGLLVAPLGDGTWVYTGIAFFRQLPAGVPGAWRLFLNLLALGEP